MSDLATHTITLRNGDKIPQFGLGTFETEGPIATEIVADAIGMGYRHIDCAQAYWNQELIAPSLKLVPREELWITSKLWRPDMPKDKVIAATDDTLRQLDCDYLDLWLIHWPDASIPIEYTLGEMQKCIEMGKVRNIGVCNATKRHIDDILATGIPIAMNQFEVHPYLLQQDLIDYCKSHGIAVTGYSPLARGKVPKDPAIQRIGEKHNRTPAQVALRWLLQKDLVVIAKTVHADRLRENAKIFDFTLTPDEMATLDAMDQGLRTINPDFNEFDYV